MRWLYGLEVKCFFFVSHIRFIIEINDWKVYILDYQKLKK